MSATEHNERDGLGFSARLGVQHRKKGLQAAVLHGMAEKSFFYMAGLYAPGAVRRAHAVFRGKPEDALEHMQSTISRGGGAVFPFEGEQPAPDIRLSDAGKAFGAGWWKDVILGDVGLALPARFAGLDAWKPGGVYESCQAVLVRIRNHTCFQCRSRKRQCAPVGLTPRAFGW